MGGSYGHKVSHVETDILIIDSLGNHKYNFSFSNDANEKDQ